MRGLEIRRGKRGRGVYSTAHFHKGMIIMDCPVLLLKSSEVMGTITNYTFVWDDGVKVKSKKNVALALGYGSLLNHSYGPNAVYKQLISREIIRVRAIVNIQVGDEILVNYNGNPKDNSPVWFDVK